MNKTPVLLSAPVLIDVKEMGLLYVKVGMTISVKNCKQDSDVTLYYTICIVVSFLYLRMLSV